MRSTLALAVLLTLFPSSAAGAQPSSRRVAGAELHLSAVGFENRAPVQVGLRFELPGTARIRVTRVRVWRSGLVRAVPFVLVHGEESLGRRAFRGSGEGALDVRVNASGFCDAFSGRTRADCNMLATPRSTCVGNSVGEVCERIETPAFRRIELVVRVNGVRHVLAKDVMFTRQLRANEYVVARVSVSDGVRTPSTARAIGRLRSVLSRLPCIGRSGVPRGQPVRIRVHRGGALRVLDGAEGDLRACIETLRMRQLSEGTRLSVVLSVAERRTQRERWYKAARVDPTARR